MFLEFNEIPKGSASLAQVYRAILKKNREVVAVKVQHIHVKPRSWADIKTIEVRSFCHIKDVCTDEKSSTEY